MKVATVTNMATVTDMAMPDRREQAAGRAGNRHFQRDPGRRRWWIWLAFMGSAPAFAQAPPAPGAGQVTGNAGALAAAAADGAKTDPTPRRAWAVVPRFSATETFTDNAVATAGAKQADLITQLSPGVRVEANTGRLKASADYSLNYFTSAKRTQADRTTNALNSFGTFEAIDRWLFLEASGVITQQNISAFGAQTAGTATVSANSTETSSFRLSPYLRGRLSNVAEYEARYTLSDTRANSALAAGVKSDEASFKLRGVSAPFGFGWSVDGTRQEVTYSGGRRTDSDLLRAILTYRFDPQIQVRASLGAEGNNYSTATRESQSTFGYGADWSPTERTQLSVFRERRFFGNGHTITFNHRLPLTVFRFTDTRDVSVLPNQLSNVGQGTYYDMLFAQLANAIPDPVARAQQVNAQLQQAGIAPNAAITAGFLTSQATVRRRQEFSLVLNGLRNTVTYTFFQTDQQSVRTGAAIADDFSTATSIKQRGMSSNFSHRLSPLTSLNVLSSISRSDDNTGQSTTSRIFNLNAATRIGIRTNASIGLRATRTEGVTPYRENAMLATVTAQF
jgi:uncharacterized protein (PEP-CTERM system associated)